MSNNIINGHHYSVIVDDAKNTMQIKHWTTDHFVSYPCNSALFARLKEYKREEFDAFIDCLLGLSD
jgi:uncharacterized protein YjhX (UPF0386 family)